MTVCPGSRNEGLSIPGSGGTPIQPKLTHALVLAAVAAGTVGVLLELAGVRSAAVSALVLVFVAVAPTAAVAGLLRGFDVFARIILAVVTAAAGITLLAMIMLATGAWSVQGGLVAIAVISAACALAQDGRAARFWCLPGVQRFPWNRVSRRVPQASRRLAGQAARQAGRARPGAAADPGIPGAGQAARPGEPAPPGTGAPGDPAPGPQPLRPGSPSVIMPAPQADSEAKQI